MRLPLTVRIFTVTLLSGVIACSPAYALVSLNDGKEKIYVSASTTITRDSNIFSSSTGTSDYLTSTSLTIEYTRRVGWIGVNGNIAYSLGRFSKNDQQNFRNPAYSAEFTKQTGRTTGSLTLNAQRSSRADASVNLRVTSWNYAAGLNFRYPIIERYSLSGSLGYSLVDYSKPGRDPNDPNPPPASPFVNLASYSASINLFYILSDARDISLGYRYRLSETSKDTSTVDQGINVGVNGRILPALNGSVQFGVQRRTPRGLRNGTTDGTFSSYFASGTTSYNFNRKASSNFTISKDFSTTATDVTIDSTSLSATFTYAINAHWSADASVGWSSNLFLGNGGLVSIDRNNDGVVEEIIRRRDRSFTWGAGLNYTMSEHFKASLNYNYSRNSSNVDFSSFDRSGYSLTLSTRW